MSRIKIMALVVFVLLGSGAAQTDPATADQGPDAKGFFSVSSGFFTLEYKVEGQNLHCVLHCVGKGWLAVGFAPTSMMKGANLIIGYVKDGVGHIRDDFGTGVNAHASDISLGGTSDVKLISASESLTVTDLEFTVPLSSGDMYDTVLRPGNAYKIIFVAGPTDDFEGEYNKIASAEIKL